MNEIEKHRAEIFEKWNNPNIIVQWENAYSVVAKPEFFSKNRPFQRFKKYKDKNGLFIVFDNKRVYEEKWKRIY